MSTTIPPGATGNAALAAAIARLRAAGVDDPARDARRLLAHALGIPAGRLTLVLPDPLTDEAADRFAAALALRCRRKPVSQITGQRMFYGRSFRVTEDVLDPRPETETLIELALCEPFSRVLDLGTGSGCILLTLLAERPEATGLGVDLSDAACAVAADNAARLALETRARITRSDWFGAVEGRFDLIVANPPYIAAEEMPGLAPEVRDWEPHIALSDGADGLGAYRIIAAQAPDHLAPGGRLLVEIGPTQGAAVSALFLAAGLENIAVHADLDGRARIVSGRVSLKQG